MKKFLFVCTLGVLMCGCAKAVENSENRVGYMTSDTTYNLIAYYPHQATMDLVCEQIPDAKDTNVIFCAEAAFTGQLLDTFSHHNIMGPHVCHGVRYNGYKYNQNYGLFAAYNDQWRIAEILWVICTRSIHINTRIAPIGLPYTNKKVCCKT